MRNRIRKRADASGLNALKKPVNDGSVLRDDSTKGIPMTERCKKASISNFKKSNGSMKSNACEDTNKNNVGRDVKDHTRSVAEDVNHPPLNTHDATNKKEEAKTDECIDCMPSTSQVVVGFNHSWCYLIPFLFNKI